MTKIQAWLIIALMAVLTVLVFACGLAILNQPV